MLHIILGTIFQRDCLNLVAVFKLFENQSLRKCMAEKFSEFDEYQLGKHGQKVKKHDIPIFCSEEDQMEEEEKDQDERELAKRRFSVKRLIRLLHIKSPVYHVMALLGKKYVK